MHNMTDPEMLARLERAMSELSPTAREVLLAHRRDGRSYAEIAAATGLTVSLVETHIAEAIYRIVRHMRRERRRRFWPF